MQARHNALFLVTGTALLSASAGFAGGYIFANRKLDGLIDDEVAKFKADYQQMHENSLTSQVEARINDNQKSKLAKVIQQEHYATSDGDEVTSEDLSEAIEEHRNIFTDTPEYVNTWDQEIEEALRDPDSPYIISQDEYLRGELDFSQINVTYFEGDDVLADDEDEHIPDIDATVGEENLTKFGHGSNDNRVVYVRNERLQMDIEVTHSDKKYTEDVLGFLKHEDRQGLRKFRDFD